MTGQIQGSLWEKTAPPPPPTLPLTGQARTRVAIVGGGFTGMSAALHLAEKGIETVVLEAEEIGHGGSGRNAGLVNAGLWLQPADVEAALGVEPGRRLNDLLGRAPDLVFSLIERHTIACEATREGTLQCAHSRSGLAWLKERARQINDRGAHVQVLDRDGARTKTGSDAYHGALYDRRAGTIQPLGYVRGLARASIDRGARVHTRSAATGLVAEGNGWRIETGNASLLADQVVLATNAYTGGLWPGLERTFVPLYFTQLASRPLGANLAGTILPGGQGAWDTRTVMVSYRCDKEGRFIIGSIGRAAPVAGATRSWASALARRLYPALGDVTWEYQWSGCIALTSDHMPRLHRLAPGVVTPIGYNGRGIGPGTVFGKAIAEHLVGAPEECLPLPMTRPGSEFLRGARALAFEAAFQLGHLKQRFF